MQGVQLVPFRLPELIEAIKQQRTVYIAEGEKGALSLVSIGLTATCSPGGAGKWKQVYTSHFAGADVVVLPDNDTPGRGHAAQVAAGLLPVARSVRVIALPDLPTKGDVFDWIAAGGTAEKLQDLAAGSAVLTAATEPPERDRRNSSEDNEVEAPAWTKFLQRDDRGEALNNLANALTAMRGAPELSSCFAYDEMQRAAILIKPVPKGSADDLPTTGPGWRCVTRFRNGCNAMICAASEKTPRTRPWTVGLRRTPFTQ